MTNRVLKSVYILQISLYVCYFVTDVDRKPICGIKWYKNLNKYGGSPEGSSKSVAESGSSS